MTTRLLVIRHGASHHTAGRFVGGRRGCRGLTDEGSEQVRRLGSRLRRELPEQPAAVYSSIIRRAVETGEILASALGVERVEQDCGLCTWHSPSYADGMDTTEFQREHRVEGGGIYRPFERENESWAEMVIRVGRSLEEIAARHAGQTVLIATHSEGVNSSLIVFGQLPLAVGFDTKIAPASITEWTTDGEPTAWPRPRWNLQRFNDSAHHFWDLGEALS